EDQVQLFVGLPLDAVSDCNSINHVRAIKAGLKALKLLGCEGVEVPVWWGIVEKEAMGEYEWSDQVT
ncbi:Inactive beta-amylase, partial [Thalictrum thalictroides]